MTAGMDQTQFAPRPAPGEFSLHGEAALPDVSGALWLADHGALVVSDLHFEKGSAFARRGVMLPPYDTAATLARLAEVVARHAPKVIVALGDSFHDGGGVARMGEADRAALRALQAGRDWIWISGNHDPDPPIELGGSCAAEIVLGALTLRHEPQAGAAPGEVAGHLHPVARVSSPAGSLRRRCFASDGARCVLPAFGAFAGGLNIRDAAFASLFADAPVTAHVMGRSRVYAAPLARCIGD
jgi:DNA ligase-associated metallophosphoesterase